MNAHFEHIAFAIHGEDITRWDRFLRATLGGDAGMGGDAPGLGFRGGQVLYPCGGMLELISWQLPADDSNPVLRYVERHGPRAALHHLTFLVDDFDSARAECEQMNYDVMPGRYGKHWKELFLRAPFLEPSKMLIQLLQTDKEAFKSGDGWEYDWDGFDPSIVAAEPAAKIIGAHLAVSDIEQAQRVFCALLGASIDDDGDIGWQTSSMKIRLQAGGDAADSHVVIDGPDSLAPALSSDDNPGGRLIRLRDA